MPIQELFGHPLRADLARLKIDLTGAENFTRRKVEPGSCVRLYGTPCRHGHACLRCPMLRPDPAQAMRLAEIITNLHDRIRGAIEHGRLGEVEGLQVSLAGARQKLQQMRKLRAQARTVDLPTPAVPGSGRPPRSTRT
ncbi:hypothetical protein [Streptosporangium sp. NPDC003464]